MKGGGKKRGFERMRAWMQEGVARERVFILFLHPRFGCMGKSPVGSEHVTRKNRASAQVSAKTKNVTGKSRAP